MPVVDLLILWVYYSQFGILAAVWWLFTGENLQSLQLIKDLINSGLKLIFEYCSKTQTSENISKHKYQSYQVHHKILHIHYYTGLGSIQRFFLLL